MPCLCARRVCLEQAAPRLFRLQISLLIPAYNAAGYLPRLEQSVRAQTSPFAEILCHDDGSADATSEIIKQLGWEGTCSTQNRGPAAARNQLLHAANFEWVHFHDADDLLEPSFVERMAIAVNANPRADVVVCQMDWLFEDSREVYRAWRYEQEQLSQDSLSACVKNPIGVIACVYRREKLKEIGGFKENYRTWEDGDLHVRLAAAGAHFVVVPEILSIGLRHNAGASADHDSVDSDRVRQLVTYGIDYPSCRAVYEEAEKLSLRLFEQDQADPRVDKLLTLCAAGNHRVPNSNRWWWQLAGRFLPAKTVMAIRRNLRLLMH